MTAAATLVSDWTLEPGAALALVAWSCLYAALVARRRRVRGRFARGRALSFAGGVVLAALALFSPLDAMAEDGSLVAHMVQHDLLALVAPLLLVAGLDAQLVVPLSRRIVHPALRRPRGARLLRALTSPWLALGVYVATTVTWSLPGAYALLEQSAWAHAGAHASLLTAGCLLWASVLEPLPSLHRARPLPKLAELAAASMSGGVVAAALVWLPAPLYALEPGASGLLGLSLGVDQQLAGVTMMAIEMPLLLGAAAWILVRAAAGRPRHHVLASAALPASVAPSQGAPIDA